MAKKLTITLDRSGTGFKANYKPSGHDGALLWPSGVRENDFGYTPSVLLGKTLEAISDTRPSKLTVVIRRGFLGRPEEKPDILEQVKRIYAEAAAQQSIDSVRLKQKISLVGLFNDCRYSAGL